MSRWRSSLREMCREAVLIRRHALRWFALPQVFVFISLAVLGAVANEPSPTLILKIAAVLYVLTAVLLLRLHRRDLTVGMLLYYLFGLMILLVALACRWQLEPFAAIYFPLALSLCCFLLLPLRAGAALLAAAIMIAFLAGLHLAGPSLLPWEPSSMLKGELLPALSSIVLLMASLFRRPHTVAHLLEVPREASSGAPEKIRPRLVSTGLTEYWRESLEGELVADVGWRLAGLSAVAALGTIIIALSLPDQNRRFALMWLGLAALQLLVHFRLLATRHYPTLAVLALMAFALALATVGALPWCGLLSSPESEALLLVLVTAFGCVPWSWRALALPALLLGIVCSVWLCFVNDPLIFLPAAIVAVAVSLRLSAVGYLAIVSRAALTFLANYWEAASDAYAHLPLVGWQLCAVVGAPRGVVLLQSGQSELLTHATARPTDADPLIVRGLIRNILDSRAEQGLLTLSLLAPEFRVVCADWFGAAPRQLFFFRWSVWRSGEEQVCLVIPVHFPILLCGSRRALRALTGIAALVRVSFAAVRSQVLSSDALSKSERIVRARDREFSELVHLVNNVAQDVAVQCDSLRELVSQHASESGKLPMQTQVEQLEMLSYALSCGVSDAKLLQELSQLREFPSAAPAKVGSLIVDLTRYGRHVAERHGQQLQAQGTLSADTLISTVNREYAEAGLRALVRLASRASSPGATLILDMTADAAMVTLTVSAREGITEARSLDTLDGDREQLDAIRRMFGAGGGSFILETSGNNNAFRSFRVQLPSATRPEAALGRARRWALLVDDNQEILTFYKRIAEALGIASHTAISAADARSLLALHHAPGLVVTDVQLQDTLAFELIEELRTNYGEDFPIIVVSGQSDGVAAEKALCAGATLYLTKPVGRRKLFEEISQLLLETGSSKAASATKIVRRTHEQQRV